MDDNFESKLRKALKNTEVFKTPDCPDPTTIGLYIENKLPEQDAARIKRHISSCLYCLDQVSEMKALLYYRDKWTTIPYQHLTKLENLFAEKKKPLKKSSGRSVNHFVSWMTAFFTFPFRQWRYVTVSVVSICAALLFVSVNDINLSDRIGFFSSKSEINGLPEINPNTFVNVRALGSSGNILRDIRGVVVDPKGIIAANLSPLAGATSVQIVLRNGKSYVIKSLWKDDGKNIALMKIEGDSLPSFRPADLKQVSIGERAFILADFSNVKDAAAEAVISDLKAYAGRRSGGDVQYVQFASFVSEQKRGALIDREGRLIGLTVSEEKNISFAAPLKDTLKLIKDQAPVAVSELKNINYSGDALNFYFKGILARNSHKQDEAIELFKKAIELNPNLEGAHIELGFIYYKKRLFDLEKKAYEEALKINPNNTDTLFYFATNLETREQYDEATRVFEKIVAIDPDDADAYYELGLAYLAQGQKAKAMDVYNPLQKLDPGLAGKLKRIVKGER